MICPNCNRKMVLIDTYDPEWVCPHPVETGPTPRLCTTTIKAENKLAMVTENDRLNEKEAE